MSQPDDELTRNLAPKFDERLRAHLKGVDIASVSRISSDRLRRTALPNIGLIELVSGSVFHELYDPHYCSSFHGGERERSDLIVERLEDDFAGRRGGLFPYRVVGIRSLGGQAAGAAHFSVLLLPGGKYAIPYLQYIYVRSEYRRQDLSEVLHTLVLAVAMADAAKAGNKTVPLVPFTVFETTPAVHGKDENARATAAERTQIHSRSGSMAFMLRRESDGTVMSSHVQPGLEPEDPPTTLIWVLRANPSRSLTSESDQLGREVIAAYYQSLRDEGFPEKNIALAESMVQKRYLADCGFCLIPLSDITSEMYVGIDAESDSTNSA